MSLLREIQDSAVDSNTGIPVLLRKCKLLAARLGNKEFKKWIENELNGYDDNNLPDYRILKVMSKGHFSGAFGRQLRNADIPLNCIDSEFREAFQYSYLRQSAAEIESLIENASGGLLQEPWPSEFIAHYSEKIYEDMACLQAWKVISLPALVSSLDAVRNSILNFVLEIEGESPDAGEAPINSNPVPQEKVNQIFNTYISGTVQNVATGSSNVSQNVTNNTSNDQLFSDLLDAIKNINADKKAKDNFVEIVENMRGAQGIEIFKEHYQRFMSLLSDHIQVFGPVIAPFLPALAEIIS
ncbi:Abort lactococcal phage infection AbiTii [gamma proteobacterium IMCC1989]|nr:Abort lactococcal phage infection AbiTii [gamma proteobacterium IMCC1989]